MKKIEDYVLSIPDFPEPGIIFRDITSVLQDADGLQLAIDSMQDCLKDIDVDVIAGTESRGFIFGVPIAYNLHKPFVPIRKKGKLPRETVSVSYDLEYGSAEIEMHKDSIKPGQKVVIVDDLIATGGTIEAAIKLVEQLGGEVVKVVFLMELAGLKGRERLNGHESDFIIADAAARYFRENGISKLPSYKALQAEIETLIQEKNSGYNDYRAKREEYRRLQTVKGNIDQILHRERKPVKRQEQER